MRVGPRGGTRALRALAGKELRDVWREKTLVVALVVQFFIAAFSAFLLFGLQGLYDPGSVAELPEARVAYVGDGGFDAHLRDDGAIEVEPLLLQPALERFRAGDLEGVVQETVEEDGMHRVTLLLAEGELETTLLVTRLQGLLEDHERQLRQEGGDRLEHEVLHYEAGERPDLPYTFAYAVLLPLLVATPVFLAGAIAGDAVSQEAQERTLLLLRAAPMGSGALVAGKLTVPVLLAPAQVLLWVGLLWLNGLAVANLGAILFATAIMAAGLGAASVLIALWVRREGQTQAAYAVVALLLAVVALLLPRDPLNMVALLATGHPDAAVWQSLALLTLAAGALVAAAFLVAGRRLRADKV